MISLDTNVLISLRSKDRVENQLASAALVKAARVGALLGFPGTDANDLRGMFSTLTIEIEWKMDEFVWEAAGLAYQGYVRRRKASGSGTPRPLATNFLIGAHAFIRNFTLLTTDKGLHRAAFPHLHIESFER